MDKNFLPLLFPDFFLKISNFPVFSRSFNKFLDFSGVETLPLLVEIPRSKTKIHQRVIHHVCDQLGICTAYTFIKEFILWLHQGKFVKVKQVKIPSLAPLQVYKSFDVMCMSL